MFVFEFNNGKVVINSIEPYKKHQPIFGHSRTPKSKNSKLEKWVISLQKNLSKF